MCGICGAVGNFEDGARPPLGEDELGAMLDALAHRGPDDRGAFRGPGVALGSRRLAILDLQPRGRMPMVSGDGRYRIVHNGEIFNFRDLRAELTGRGHRFTTETDTEVLLAAFAEWGADMLGRLNGMWAFAIWDERERSLFLSRDRLGVKPLFLARHAGRLWFASEPKALFAAGVPATFDEATWGELLCFRYTAGRRTVWRGVERLLPGHSLQVDRRGPREQRWWNLAQRAAATPDQVPGGDAAAAAWFREVFDSAVALRRISDVPVGVLLSGGLDSGSVAAALGAAGARGLASFTVRFAAAGYDEGPLARQVAQRWELEPHELVLGDGELLGALDEASWFNDEPLAHGNDPHLLAISRHAKPRVTVLLSGEGADETLGGYVRYQPLRHPATLGGLAALARGLPVGLAPHRARKLLRLLRLGGLDRAVLYDACDVLPDELGALGLPPGEDFAFREQRLEEARGLYPTEPFRQAMYLDQHTFLCSVLDRNDRMTMAASIECRVPFLDYRLVEALAAAPTSVLRAGRGTKGLLRAAVGERLPTAVLRHRKWGFGVPWAQHLRGEPALRAALTALPATEPVASGPLDRARLRALVARFQAGDDRPLALLRQLLMIVAWHRACVGPLSRAGARAAGSAVGA